jgi:hypothetical protein
MRYLAVACIVAVFVSSCVGAAGSPSPTSTGTPITEPSPTAAPTPGCPTAAPMSVDQYFATDPACFGSRDVKIAGWEDVPDYTSEPQTPPIAPAWLVERAPAVLGSQMPPTACDATSTTCPWLDIHLDPASGLRFELDGVWAVVTGHRGDPAAETCHALAPTDTPEPTDTPVPTLKPDDVRATCRDAFVLTSVTASSPPAGALAFCPPDGMLTVTAYTATDPACFHGKDLRIVGWVGEIPALDFDGPTLAPSWLEYPASVIWSVPPVVSEGNGSCPETSAEGTCIFMFAMLDPKGGVPSPLGHRWVILTGHIDDPVSETCSYAGGGPFGGSPPPAVYARQDCRRAFVITSVEYTTAPSPSP